MIIIWRPVTNISLFAKESRNCMRIKYQALVHISVVDTFLDHSNSKKSIQEQENFNIRLNCTKIPFY